MPNAQLIRHSANAKRWNSRNPQIFEAITNSIFHRYTHAKKLHAVCVEKVLTGVYFSCTSTFMETQSTIFDLFGGIRPMARILGEPASNVAAWKREGRIPAIKQPHVLAMANANNLPITAHDIIFPLGSDTSSASDATATIGNAAPITEGRETKQ